MNRIILTLGIGLISLNSCVAQKNAASNSKKGATSLLQHVEPANWWAGMNYAEVEVLLHGKDISKFSVLVKGLDILEVKKTENPNYLFVKVNTKNKPVGSYPVQLSDGKKIVAEHIFELKARRENSAARTGCTPKDVIYLIMPDRFANGDPSNDSHPATIEKVNRNFPGGRHGGDIQGIINHLDYIKELGATAIWTTPLLEDNDTTYSYHTYGQSDLYKVDPRYGTNADFVRMVEEAHKRGLKILKDEVPNHWGYTHWMMKDLPTYDWIHQFPGYAQSNYRTSTQMDPNSSKRDQKYCEEGWFVRSMPDLNQGNPLVLNYLIQNTIWWVEFANLDALRVDTYSYNQKEGIAKWTKAIMDEYPNFSMVGEIWMHDQAQISYWQKDSPISAIQNYNTYLPQVMDFTLHDALQEAFKENNQGWDKGMVRIYENFVNDFLYKNASENLIFLENHDTQRFNEIYPKMADYKMAMALLATTRGIPQIYYGSEIGMKGDKNTGGDASIRQDFPGGWKEDSKNAFTKEGRSDFQENYFQFTKKILNWRKNNAVIHEGKLVQFLPENNVYVYFRVKGKERVMVVINNSDKEEKIKKARFAEELGGFTEANEVITNLKVNLMKEEWNIPAKTAYIFELK
ncbi:MAG: alpha-amlyase [Flavobacteriales bacterium]|nr:alpha-amlyase [Flavobacteriales bacterium]